MAYMYGPNDPNQMNTMPQKRIGGGMPSWASAFGDPNQMGPFDGGDPNVAESRDQIGSFLDILYNMPQRDPRLQYEQPEFPQEARDIFAADAARPMEMPPADYMPQGGSEMNPTSGKSMRTKGTFKSRLADLMRREAPTGVNGDGLADLMKRAK